MKFRKFQHIERYGKEEVEGILFGTCHIFSKVDGTNASVWYDEEKVKAGSRRRELGFEKDDNAGFNAFINSDEGKNIRMFVTDHPNLTIYGEWLVPHTLKTYKDDAWRKFYAFDVVDETGKHLNYEVYKKFLDFYKIDYIAPIQIIHNPTYENIIKLLERNTFLIKDGEGQGEGIVIKNYDFVNKYGRTTWAKIVTTEFQAKHSRVMGAPKSKGSDMVEAKIVDKYITKALCEKEYAKIKISDDWKENKKLIPRLLNTVYHCLITEESWNFVKQFKNPVINYRTLQFLTSKQIREHLPNLF